MPRSFKKFFPTIAFRINCTVARMIGFMELMDREALVVRAQKAKIIKLVGELKKNLPSLMADVEKHQGDEDGYPTEKVKILKEAVSEITRMAIQILKKEIHFQDLVHPLWGSVWEIYLFVNEGTEDSLAKER